MYRPFQLALRIGCYPFQDRDPFVLEETPHIFFAGNQPEYATRLVHGTYDIGVANLGDDGQKVRIICLPRFSKTGEIVLVNLSTLESELVRFSSGAIKKEVNEAMNETTDVAMDDIAEL